MPAGAADGDTLVVLDPGVNTNSLIALQPQGPSAQALRARVTSVGPGHSFTVTVAGSATLLGPLSVWYLRTD